MTDRTMHSGETLSRDAWNNAVELTADYLIELDSKSFKTGAVTNREIQHDDYVNLGMLMESGSSDWDSFDSLTLGKVNGIECDDVFKRVDGIKANAGIIPFVSVTTKTEEVIIEQSDDATDVSDPGFFEFTAKNVCDGPCLLFYFTYRLKFDIEYDNAPETQVVTTLNGPIKSELMSGASYYGIGGRGDYWQGACLKAPTLVYDESTGKTSATISGYLVPTEADPPEELKLGGVKGYFRFYAVGFRKDPRLGG